MLKAIHITLIFIATFSGITVIGQPGAKSANKKSDQSNTYKGPTKDTTIYRIILPGRDTLYFNENKFAEIPGPKELKSLFEQQGNSITIRVAQQQKAILSFQLTIQKTENDTVPVYSVDDLSKYRYLKIFREWYCTVKAMQLQDYDLAMDHPYTRRLITRVFIRP